MHFTVRRDTERYTTNAKTPNAAAMKYTVLLGAVFIDFVLKEKIKDFRSGFAGKGNKLLCPRTSHAWERASVLFSTLPE
jgi:hypothetical protein